MMLHSRIHELTEGIKGGIFAIAMIRIIITITYIIQAFYLAEMIEIIIGTRRDASLAVILSIIIAILLIRASLVFLASLAEKYYSSRIKTHIRNKCFAKIFYSGPSYLTDKNTGKLESTMVSGVEYLEAYLVRYIPQILVTVISSSLLVFSILYINLNIGLFVLGLLLLALFAPKYLKQMITKSSNEHWAAFTTLNAQFMDSIQGMITLIAFNANERRKQTLQGDSDQLYKRTMINLRNSLMSIGISDIFMTLGIAMSVGIAAYSYAKGNIDINNLLILMFLTKETFRPIEDLKKFYHQGFNGISAADSLFEIIDYNDGYIDGKLKLEAVLAEAQSPSIEFDHVSFAYAEDLPNVLNDISFKINSREKVAIVGKSGTGKTTIINLLLGFYRNYQGSIKINGIELSDIKYDDLLQLFAIVAQDTYLFNLSIYDNLKLANSEATDQAIRDVVQASHLNDFVAERQNGLDSLIGERGSKLSGGQKQRISIARALLKDAPILILDEPTSSLDNESEGEIQKNLSDIAKQKTTITIAHRLSTIVDSDRILVLKDGKITESGTHLELLKNNKDYKQLFEEQFEIGVVS